MHSSASSKKKTSGCFLIGSSGTEARSASRSGLVGAESCVHKPNTNQRLAFELLLLLLYVSPGQATLFLTSCQ